MKVEVCGTPDSVDVIHCNSVDMYVGVNTVCIFCNMLNHHVELIITTHVDHSLDSVCIGLHERVFAYPKNSSIAFPNLTPDRHYSISLNRNNPFSLFSILTSPVRDLPQPRQSHAYPFLSVPSKSSGLFSFHCSFLSAPSSSANFSPACVKFLLLLLLLHLASSSCFVLLHLLDPLDLLNHRLPASTVQIPPWSVDSRLLYGR